MKRIWIATACALSLGAADANAHAFLKTATPAVGSTVAQAPGQVLITFTEGVEPSFTTITVEDSSGANMCDGDVHAAGASTRVAVALKPLHAGVYKVVWHAVSTDTHKTEGNYTFTVAP
jgi:methionine-rich copper-binding protein CopC